MEELQEEHHDQKTDGRKRQKYVNSEGEDIDRLNIL
jgi:hypothetical protein